MSKKQNTFHENYDRVEAPRTPSEKSFGITIGIIFLLLSVLPLIFHHAFRWWALLISSVFFIITFVEPKLLTKPNIYWFRFGLILNKLISPVVLFFLFFFVFLPTGLLLKLFKKDVLNLKLDKFCMTYWIKSETTGSSMRDQF